MKALRKWACIRLSFSVCVNEDGPFRVGGVSRQAQISVISTYVVRIHLDRPLPHPDIFESTTFSFGYGPHPHVSGEGRHTNRQLF